MSNLFHLVVNNKNTIRSKWLNEDILSLSDTTFKIPDEYQYEIFQVPEKFIARPDLLSTEIYGSAEYTDVICKLNGISNPFELNAGMLLIIPSPDCVLQFVVHPTKSESDSNEKAKTNKYNAKKKNEPRKANEAVLSDKRFKIDRTRNVVVY